MTTPCPECTTAVPIPADAIEGELLVCDHCAVELELVSRTPLRIEVFEEEEK
ncbi:MAG: lysine biosynthesis protein LysW [Proteobacteria bacterium]|nr:lysine biosynthesis protein LysW [Pseudomonadota bacterium]